MTGLSLSRFFIAAATLALAVLAVFAVLDRLGDNQRATARQALLMRAAELERSALAPGSMLPCVDGTAGETIDNACEKRVFASAQSAAAAVAYMGARIDLLNQAHALVKNGDKRAPAALASTRRAVSLDRYGIAAHVLSRRDGCTANQCAVFALLTNADALKANLRAQTFDQYVSRYAANWDASGGKGAPVVSRGPAMSALPAGTPDVKEAQKASPLQTAEASGDEARAEVTPPGTSVVRKPVSSKWHFPSADSIPAVSIMTPEPKLPKDLANQLNRDTARRAAIEQRKAARSSTSAKDSKDAHSQDAKKKQAETRQQAAPGAPLQLTR
jgi:hypothetical protein